MEKTEIDIEKKISNLLRRVGAAPYLSSLGNFSKIIQYIFARQYFDLV